MRRCIYSGVEFTEADGEHILQNFLGCRWTSNEIVCDEVQQVFGHGIDVALEKNLQPLRNLLGTRGGRRGEGPTLKGLQTTKGERVNMLPGGKPDYSEPIVEVEEETEGRHRVQMRLGTIKQIGWALAKLRREYPDLKVSEEVVRPLAQSVSGFVSGQVVIPLKIGGSDSMRGALKSCFNLLGAVYPDRVHDACFDGVRSFILEGGDDPAEFIRWTRDEDRLDIHRLGTADQFIALNSRYSCVDGVIQFFGDIVFSIRLASTYKGAEISCGYQVDPFREAEPAETRQPQFDVDVVPVFDQQPESPDEETIRSFKTRLTRIVQGYYDRADQELVQSVIDEVLRPHEGELFTEELAGNFAQAIAERFIERHGHRLES